MTATIVDGKQVIATEPAETALSGLHGKPIYYKQIVRLLLDDDSEVFACVHCDYTAPNVQSVYPHLRKHKQPAATNGATPSPELDLSISLGTLLDGHRQAAAYLESIERLSADRDQWKARALAAERWRRQAQNLFAHATP